ncbi:MAG TPA: 6-pyruvoyl-tetrahydropterin synthase-related protein, partial [Candidatus Methylomirabilis sp.]
MPVVALVVGAGILALAHPSLWSRDAVMTRDHVDFYLRVHQYQRELQAGHWPQVLPDAVHGGGHAFPRFYPPVAQFAAVALNLIVGDVVRATHLAALLTVLLSGIGMFVLVRRVGGRTLPAFLAMIAYSMMPYRFMVLNVRGAFAEAWAFVWYPLVLLGVWHAIRDHRFPVWWPLTLAALLCTHAVLSLWAVPAFLAVVILVPEVRTLRALLRPGVIAAVLG